MVEIEENQEGALALRQAILDRVLEVYHAAHNAAGWEKAPPHIDKAMQEIFELVTHACEIEE